MNEQFYPPAPPKDNIRSDEKSFDRAYCKESAEDKQQLGKSKKSTSELKHWSITKEGSMIARANAYLYKSIISKPRDGGIVNFFEQYCHMFVSDDEKNEVKTLGKDSLTGSSTKKAGDGEYSLEHYAIFTEYISKVERILKDFAKNEGINEVTMVETCKNACLSHHQAEKAFQILIGAFSFNKFVVLMRNKAEILKKEGQLNKRKLK